MTNPDSEFSLEQVPQDQRYVRFREALESIGVTQSQLARECGISEGSISRGVRHGTGLDIHWTSLAETLMAHGINDRWLLYGNGEMRAASSQSATPPAAFPALTAVAPLEGLVEVGVVTELASYSEPSVPRSKSLPGDQAVLVQDSAMDPLIRPGQWVLLAPDGRAPKDGELALVKTKAGDAYVRRYRPSGDTVVLEHLNQDRRYRAMVLQRGDIASARVIVGVVFE